jgi:LPXTG-motif cell wall-anchored protein
MPRRLLIALATLGTALAVVPDAWAKGPVTSLEVCGADGCASVPVPHRLKGPLGLEQLMVTARAAAEMPTTAPFYRLRVGYGEGGTLTMYYLRGGEVLRDQDWVVLGPRLSHAIDAAVAGQPPIVPLLASVRIDGHRVADARAYAPLLRPLPVSSGTVGTNVTRSVGIYLITTAASPWGLGRVVFALFDPRTKLVDVGGAVRVPPDAVRDAIEQDAGIAGTGESRSGAVWAGGATALAASAGVLLMRRRRRRGEDR